MGRSRSRVVGWLLLILVVGGIAGYFYWLADRPVATRESDAGLAAEREAAARSAPRSSTPRPEGSPLQKNAPATAGIPPQPKLMTVSGYVENATGERVADAVVTLSGTIPGPDKKKGTPVKAESPATGPDGAFSVTIAEGCPFYGVGVACEGYRLKDVTSTGKIDVPKDSDKPKAVPAGYDQEAQAAARDATWRQNHLAVPLKVPADGLHDVVVTLTRATRISGRIVDRQHRPLRGVVMSYGMTDPGRANDTGSLMVTLQQEGARPTDEQGRFVLANLAPGYYAIWGRYAPLRGDQEFDHCVMLGCSAYPLGEVALQEGEWLDNVEIQAPLGDGGSIEGSVVDQGGAGIEGARVFAIMVGNGAAGLTVTPTPKTGAFRIERILAEHPGVQPPKSIDKVTLRAECEGFEPLAVEDVAVGARGVRLTMMRERRGTIAVRLRDAGSGSTIRDATVKLWRTETTWGENRADRAVLGGDPTKDVKPDWLGWFVLKSVPAGVSEIVVKARGYGIKQHGGIIVKEGETTKVDLSLEGAGLICAQAVGNETVNGWKASPSTPSIIAIADSGSDRGANNQRLDLSSNDCPPSTLTCDAPPEREPPFTHRNFAVPPGRYLVQFHMTLSDPSVHATTGEGLRLADASRYIPTTVTSGAISRVEFSMARGEAGSVEVVPPPDCRVIELFPGDTLPPIVNHRRAPIPPPDATTEYHRVSAINPPFVFPCVAPGNYLAACSLEGKWEEPVTKSITVVAGQTLKVVFE